MSFIRIFRDRADEKIAVIRLSPRSVLAALCVSITLLTVLSTLAIAAYAVFRWPENSLAYQLVKLFWLDSEYNLPTIYQIVTLGIAALLLLLVARKFKSINPSDERRWRVLGVVFLVLAVDEGARIHERVGTSIHRLDAANNYLVPAAIYLPVLFLMFLWFLPLLRRINSSTRRLIIASGLLYVGGALCIEAVGQAYARLASKETILYAALASLEEVFEMAGVALLIYTLLKWLGHYRENSSI